MIRQKVNEIDNTAEVILYGSRARGDNKWDSDWDVMILLKRNNVDKKVEQTFRHHLLDLELEFGVPHIDNCATVTVNCKQQYLSKGNNH